ncbi:hercynine oxygenase [Sideroxyarcus emersonii]|uniref:Hercynine oxygenase n=2 Tax=Sideroxyarcus emersonii TaxID=2764705 RepID=A0AAN2BZZ6_9PROT|nr:hercynine oxygenase [Sideroxyarcus emersonii]
MPTMNKNTVQTPADLQRKKKYLSATIITCIALVMIGGSLHVVKLGSIRMGEMRALATYNLKEESSRIRAAGEDIALHEENENRKNQAAGYTPAEADALLTPEQWKELGSSVLIPAGKFLMGTNLKNADAASHPQHTVQLKAYRIDKYLVTNAQYARFIAATGHRPPSDWKDGKIPQGTALYPVTLVNWYDATAYAKWAGKRLPTEAEWEKAARGTDGRRWPWGNEMDPARLNTYYNVGSASNVNTYSNGVSPYGVYDMAGNVDEWVADDFEPYKGTDAAAEVFQGKMARVQSEEDKTMKVADLVPVNRQYKVLRGGSWKGDPFSTATYHRDYSWPNYASDFYGFRCASSVDE